MFDIINISEINDFLYCPKSLYLHSIYNVYDKKVFQDIPQVAGSISHNTIDNATYTTSKHIFQGISVYSDKFYIKGKIDVYDSKKHTLIERKNLVKQIYKGYKFQLYAQMLCLNEIGYKVDHLFVHSLSDNKRYDIPLPSNKDIHELEITIQQMRSFDTEMLSKHKCKNCDGNIYSLLNW